MIELTDYADNPEAYLTALGIAGLALMAMGASIVQAVAVGRDPPAELGALDLIDARRTPTCGRCGDTGVWMDRGKLSACDQCQADPEAG